MRHFREEPETDPWPPGCSAPEPGPIPPGFRCEIKPGDPNGHDVGPGPHLSGEILPPNPTVPMHLEIKPGDPTGFSDVLPGPYCAEQFPPGPQRYGENVDPKPYSFGEPPVYPYGRDDVVPPIPFAGDPPPVPYIQ